jgi:hypothetical protein
MEQPITERRGHREPWNKGKLVGQKAPLRLKEIWAIRISRPARRALRTSHCRVCACVVAQTRRLVTLRARLVSP